MKELLNKQQTEKSPNQIQKTIKKQVSSNWQQFTKKPIKQGQQQEPNLSYSLHPQPNSFKGETPIVAIDCEMVNCKESDNSRAQQELARVSIVNYNGHTLFDSYVRPTKKIVNYLTHVSGITYSLIKSAPVFQEIKQKIHNILSNKIIVGHSVQNDFDVLKYNPQIGNIRDISNFKLLKNNGKKMSLKNMAKNELNIDFQEGQHDSVQDARVAMLIYRKYQKQIDKQQSLK